MFSEINMFIVWLVLLVIFAVIEIMSVALVSIWFCAGALVAMVLAVLNVPIIFQIAAFLVVSIVLMIVMIPVLREKINRKNVRTNADRVVGQIAVVTEDIDNDGPSGAVRVDGKVWTARSKDGEVIPKGAKVGVDCIDGVKLIVTPVED